MFQPTKYQVERASGDQEQEVLAREQVEGSNIYTE